MINLPGRKLRTAYAFSEGDIMAKIMHVQTVLVVEDIEALKMKTGEPSTKDALAKAVAHFLECEYTQTENMWTKKLENVVKKRSMQNEEEIAV